MTQPDRRSACPIACTLDLLGDRWTLLVLRDLFLGKRRFDELMASPEGISTNILAERLKRLEALRLVAKAPYGAHPNRFDYALTERGRSLGPVLHRIAQWGLEHLEGTRRFPEAERLVAAPPAPGRRRRERPAR